MLLRDVKVLCPLLCDVRRYTTPLKETLTTMLAGDLSLDAFPSLLPMPVQVGTARCVLVVTFCDRVRVEPRTPEVPVGPRPVTKRGAVLITHYECDSIAVVCWVYQCRVYL